MDFLADESCAWPVIRALREAGHDVIAIAEVAKGATDEQVLERAFKENRVLITEDRDFGELVYAQRRPSTGVILLRFDSRARRLKPPTIVDAISKLESRLKDSFAVIETRTRPHRGPTLRSGRGFDAQTFRPVKSVRASYVSPARGTNLCRNSKIETRNSADRSAIWSDRDPVVWSSAFV